MSGNVVSISQSPSVAARAIGRFIATPHGPVTLHEIARRLNMNALSPRSIIDQVRLLNKGYGFPDPSNPRFEKGRLVLGPRAIVQRSLWPRDAVEAWFGSHRSPANAALSDPLAVERTRAALATNARIVAGRAA